MSAGLGINQGSRIMHSLVFNYREERCRKLKYMEKDESRWRRTHRSSSLLLESRHRNHVEARNLLEGSENRVWRLN